MAISAPVFNRLYIENTDTSVNTTTSAPFAAGGNRAVLNVTIRNLEMEGMLSVVVTLQGSYDGLAWEDTAAVVDRDEFGQQDDPVGSSGGTFDYAWARVSAQISATQTSTPSRAIIDTNVVFSHQ